MNGTMRQRGPNSWEIQVFLGRDSNGKRIRKTETVRGKKSDADRRRREILTEIDRGGTPAKTRYLLGEWLDKWLEEKIIPNRKPKTIERYEGIIRLHIKPALGHIKISKLSPSDVQDLETRLLLGGPKKPMAPKGVGSVHGVLNGAMEHALSLELIARNPVARVTPPTVPKVEAYMPTDSEVKDLLALAEAENHPLWECIYLIAYTGMRRGEALALEWEHVDLVNLLVLIEQSLVATREGLLLQPPKTENGRRVIELDHETGEILKNRKANQEALAARLGISPPEKLFPRFDQVSWTHPNTVSYALRSFAKRVGCPEITFRSLRHFHISMMLQAGQNVTAASKRAGHSSPQITLDVYAHCLPEWQRGAAEAFAEAMKKAA